MPKDMTENGKHKWAGKIFCQLEGLKLYNLYRLLDKCDKPYSCVVKKAYKGIRWVKIECSKEDIDFFKELFESSK